MRIFVRKAASDIQADVPAGEAWTNSIAGFVMAFSAVLSALTALTNGRTTSARLQNVAALAHWSRNDAGRVYHLAKTLGLLRTTPVAAPIGLVSMAYTPVLTSGPRTASPSLSSASAPWPAWNGRAAERRGKHSLRSAPNPV